MITFNQNITRVTPIQKISSINASGTKKNQLNYKKEQEMNGFQDILSQAYAQNSKTDTAEHPYSSGNYDQKAMEIILTMKHNFYITQ